MSNESKVVSIRLSEEDRARLKKIADLRGTSLSDLLRSAAMREMGQDLQSPAVTVSTSPTNSYVQVDHGVFWDAPQGAQVSGGTLSFRAL